MNKIINICFSRSAGETFKHAISNEEFQINQKVIVLFDNLSQGAIKGGVNIEKRINWYDIFMGEDLLKSFVDCDIDELKENYNTFHDEISKIDTSDTLYIWYGSSREICGMMYTLELLKNKNLNIYLIDVKDTVVRRKKIKFKARDTREIIPENIEKYVAAKRKLDLNEYKELLDRWAVLKEENSILRVIDGGKVESVNQNYFDIYILKYTPKEFRNYMRTIGDVLGRSEDTISDEYIFWRIKELVKSGKIECNGEFGVTRGMKIKITDEGLKYLSTDKEAMKIWEENRKG